MLLPFPVPGISPVSAPTLLAALKASPDLSLLTAGAAIVAASVNPVLAAPGSAAALFAPTNDALTSGLAALGTTPDAFLQYRNAGAILKVLQYHLSLSDDGPLFTDDARPGPIMVPSLLGEGSVRACCLLPLSHAARANSALAPCLAAQRARAHTHTSLPGLGLGWGARGRMPVLGACMPDLDCTLVRAVPQRARPGPAAVICLT